MQNYWYQSYILLQWHCNIWVSVNIKKDRNKGFCPFLILALEIYFKDKILEPPKCSAHGGGRKTYRHASKAGEGLVHFVGWASVASLISPRYLTRGGHKKQETIDITKRKRCIYKAKPYFYSSDINCTYITMKIE